ncbi:MAG: glycosyltransferase [Acidobacteriota bacterium]|nr:glycosyltransferase [Acidobacteriota bacterium]
MKNLLIFAYYFPPLETIAAHRFGKMCRHMPKFGRRPVVICPDGAGGLDHGLEPDQVIRVGTWETGLDRAAAVETTRGMNPLVAPLYKLGKRLRFNLRAYDRSVASWGRAVQKAWPKISGKLPTVDCVLSTYGPSAGNWLARRYAKAMGVPWVIDYRDACSLYPLDRGPLVRFTDRCIERHVISRAAGFVTVSPTLKEIIGNHFGMKGAVVYNGWDPSDHVDAGGEEPGDYLFYGGRMYPHQMPAFSKLLQALAAEPHQRLLFLSLGPPELEARLRREADALGLGNRLDLREPVPHAEAAALAAKARLTLVVEDLDTSGKWSRGTLTGKLMQLIALPGPVLCVARPDSDIGEVLTRTGKGRLCSEVDQIQAFLHEVDNGFPPGDPEGIAFFSREQQAGELCRFLDDVCS